MAQISRKEQPFSIELNSFRTLNARDSAVTMKDDEMPYCMNLVPVGTSLLTVPGVSATKIDTVNSAAPWQSAAAYFIGNIVRPTVRNGFVYVATVGGFAGIPEPTWNTTPGGSTTDGQVTWRTIDPTVLKGWFVNIGGTNYHIVAFVGGVLFKYTTSWNSAVKIWPIDSAASATFFTNPEIAMIGQTWVCIVDSARGFLVYDGTTITQPTGGASITGTTICYHKTRLFVGNGARTISYTTPLTIPPALADFNNCFTLVGSGSVVDPYGSLSNTINKLIATGEYIYVVGDHGTHLLYGVQLIDTGSTTFQLEDRHPGIGTPWPQAVQTLRGEVYSFGDVGAHVVQGSGWEAISSLLDNLVTKIDTSFSPIAFFAKIYNKIVYCVIVKHTDLIDGNTVKTIWCFYENRWFQVNYGTTYDFIAAWGSSSSSSQSAFAAYGTYIVELFTGATVTTRRFKTKSSNFSMPLHDKQVTRVGVALSSDSGLTANLSADIQMLGNIAKANATVVAIPTFTQWTTNGGVVAVWTGATWRYSFDDTIAPSQCDGRGKRLQVSYSETSAQVYTLTGVLIEGIISADW